MLRTGDILDLGPLETQLIIKKTAVETDGQSFEMEMVVGPQNPGPPLHTHPHAAEVYEVLDGEIELNVDGAWQTYSAGEKAVIAKGIPHTYRNASLEPVRVYNKHQPAMQFSDYFETMRKVANSEAVTAQPTSFKALLHFAVMMTSYPEEIRSVAPPYPVMRLFGWIGQLLGYRV
ncbi:MAG: cupin domain-containing protein [Chloroflexota bacterium]|nr:cupin domain-containing protein [Chloroflexota bacterium]